MYKLISPGLIDGAATIKRLSDGAFIPSDPENRDYQGFLAWQAEGNDPEPADPPEEP